MITLEEFLAKVERGEQLGTPETADFMDTMSDEARKVTCRINATYHSREELVELLSELTGKRVDPSVKLFPPIYADFGKNITLGKNVFINDCCHFQDHGGVTIGDGTLIGHNVVFATINHDMRPEHRNEMKAAPIRLGKDVWVGSNVTFLPGVTVGDGAIVAAGAVVTHGVAPRTVVAGVPARKMKDVP